MNVRKAISSDVFALAELRWDFHNENPGANGKTQFVKNCSEWIENALSADNWFIVVAEVDDVVIGCIYLQSIEKVPSPGKEQKCWGYVTNSFVKSQYRRKGVGEKILKRVIDIGRERGMELLLVWPSTSAITFYSDAGFRDVSDVHSAVDDCPPMEYCF